MTSSRLPGSGENVSVDAEKSTPRITPQANDGARGLQRQLASTIASNNSSLNPAEASTFTGSTTSSAHARLVDPSMIELSPVVPSLLPFVTAGPEHVAPMLTTTRMSAREDVTIHGAITLDWEQSSLTSPSEGKPTGVAGGTTTSEVAHCGLPPPLTLCDTSMTDASPVSPPHILLTAAPHDGMNPSRQHPPGGIIAAVDSEQSLRWTVSLRTIFVVLILFVGVSVSVATLVPVFLSANAAVDQTISQLRTETIERINGDIKSYFDSATKPLATLTTQFLLETLNPLWVDPVPWQVSPYQWQTIVPTLCAQVFGQGGFFTYLATERGDFMSCSYDGIYVSNRSDPSRLTTMQASLFRTTSCAVMALTPAPATTLPATTSSNTTTFVADSSPFAEPSSTSAPGEDEIVTFDVNSLVNQQPYDARLRPWYALLTKKKTWSALYVNFSSDTVVVTFGGPIRYKSRVVGAIARDIGTQLFHQVMKATLSPESRCVLVEYSTGNVLGTSWEINVTKAINDPISGKSTLAVKTINDFSDPLVNRMLSMYPWDPVLRNLTFSNGSRTGGTSGAATAPGTTDAAANTPEITERNTGGINANAASFTMVTERSLFPSLLAFQASLNVRTFVDIVPLYDDYGLNLRLIVLTPEIDFNKDFQRALNISVLAIALALAALVVLSGLTAYRLMSPLMEVAVSMEVVDTLQDDPRRGGGSQPPTMSWLSEVSLIQIRYAQLKAQLRRVSSYLPQSVALKLLRAETDDVEDLDDLDDIHARGGRVEGTAGKGAMSHSDQLRPPSKMGGGASGGSNSTVSSGNSNDPSVTLDASTGGENVVPSISAVIQRRTPTPTGALAATADGNGGTVVPMPGTTSNAAAGSALVSVVPSTGSVSSDESRLATLEKSAIATDGRPPRAPTATTKRFGPQFMQADAITRLEQSFLLVTKRVTLASINLNHFHASTRAVPSITVLAVLSKYTAMLVSVAETNKGVVHAMHGDHALLSFNASQRCLNHAECATLAAFRICLEMGMEPVGGRSPDALPRKTSVASGLPPPFCSNGVTVGIATGAATVGRTGSEVLKQFSIVGSVYRTAMLLERLCKRYPESEFSPTFQTARCLLDQNTAETCEVAVITRTMDLMPMAEVRPLQDLSSSKASSTTTRRRKVTVTTQGAAPMTPMSSSMTSMKSILKSDVSAQQYTLLPVLTLEALVVRPVDELSMLSLSSSAGEPPAGSKARNVEQGRQLLGETCTVINRAFASFTGHCEFSIVHSAMNDLVAQYNAQRTFPMNPFTSIMLTALKSSIIRIKTLLELAESDIRIQPFSSDRYQCVVRGSQVGPGSASTSPTAVGAFAATVAAPPVTLTPIGLRSPMFSAESSLLPSIGTHPLTLTEAAASPPPMAAEDMPKIALPPAKLAVNLVGGYPALLTSRLVAELGTFFDRCVA